MSKIEKRIILISSILIFTATITSNIFASSSKSHISKPHSDVAVEYKIGWWAYQDALKVEDIKAEILYASLDLFNSKALVQYTISGSMKYKNGWRPYIKSAFISERWISQPGNFKDNHADIQIIPIIGVKQDDKYTGELLEFKINIQDYLNTGGWGKNTYRISAQSQEDTIELQQNK